MNFSGKISNKLAKSGSFFQNTRWINTLWMNILWKDTLWGVLIEKIHFEKVHFVEENIDKVEEN